MLQWLIVHTTVTAALAVVAAAAGRCFRLGPAARHFLWLIVLVKFLTPPVIYWPWPLPAWPVEPPPQPTAPPSAPMQTVILDVDPDAVVEPATPRAEAVVAPAAAPAVPSADAAAVATPFSWDWLPAAALWAWVGGAAFVACRHGLGVARWQRRLRGGRPAPDWLTALVGELAAAAGVKPPRLVVLPGAASPMVWAFGAPRLLWPAGLEGRLSAEGVRAVLLHELAHVRRWDHWIGWLLLAGGCVWWWHPLFWWVRRRLTQEAELACDAQIVGASPDGRRAYAEALLEVSQRLSSAAAAPALGAAGGRRDLERRLVMIMREPATRRLSWLGLAGVGVLGLLTLPTWTLGEDPKPKPTPSAAPILAGPPGDPTAATAVAPPVVTPAPGEKPGAVFYQPVTTYQQRTVYEPVTSYQAVDPKARAADRDRDQRIEELEEKVRQLLKEIEQLRGPTPSTEPKAATPSTSPNAAQNVWDYLTKSGTVRVAPPAATAVPESPTEVITLTRVAYKLKPAAAEALAGFLKDNVKAPILETKVDGETLTVTTTPEYQHAIGEFIGLIQGKAPGRPGMMGSMMPPGMAPGGFTPPVARPPGTPFSGPDPAK
jgi:beta-lactamase regulating signal transducer with metallopeptidase domain